MMELLPTIDALHWIADSGAGDPRRRDGPLPAALPQDRSARCFAYEPLGVVGVIAPWNYPWSIPFGEVAIALMGGNGVVLKPASLTPLIGQRIQDGLRARGPARGARPDRPRRRRRRPGAGRVERGEDLLHRLGGGRAAASARRARERMKGSVLELGGKDPMLVLRRREPPERRLRRALGRLRQRRPDLLGHRARLRDARGGRPLHRRRRRGRAARCASATRSTGTPRSGRWSPRSSSSSSASWSTTPWRAARKLHCGGPVEAPGPRAARFYAPAVLTGVTHDMRIMREEIFGPVLPIVDRATREEEAIALANDSEFGLGASVWTRDRVARRADRAASSSRGWSGSTTTCTRTAPASARGAASRTPGLGRAHSKFGFYECVNVKLRRLGAGSRTRNFWWHPYDESLGKAMRAAAKLLYGRDADTRARAARGRSAAKLAARSGRGADLQFAFSGSSASCQR